MSTPKGTSNEKRAKWGIRTRFRGHNAAHSSDHPPRIDIDVNRTRSKSQHRSYAATPTVHSTRSRYKIKMVNKERASSVGKKNKNKETKQIVTESMINAPYLTAQSTKITATIGNIEKTIQKLTKTQELIKNELHQKFEGIMIKIKEQQLSLEQEMQDIAKTKTDVLNAQIEELKQYKDHLKVVEDNFAKHHPQYNYMQVTLDFLNQAHHQKYNIPSIQPSVSSNIMLQFDQNAINTSIAAMGVMDSGEVPLYPPIIKAINKSANSIQVKCFPPKKSEDQLLEITKFEVEYILLPKQYKTRWKKMKKSIFEVLKDDMKRNDDDSKESDASRKTTDAIIINNHRKFKRNVMFINDLEYNCDYLLRARCYNVCGFGPWSISPKLITIYPMKTEGHWQFEWESFTDNMTVSDDKKTVTKTKGKMDWNCVAKGPCFPINFIESQMKIYWDARIDYCHAGDTGSLHFGIMHKKVKPEDVWHESIGFAEYDSVGMEKYVKSPSFENESVVRIVVDFKLMTVSFYEGNEMLASQKLGALKQKISDLCFGIGSYRKKNSITLM